MAKRVSPLNMNREIAWLCPRVLECGSSVSGSLAAMLTIFFASAVGAATNPTTVNANSSTRHAETRMNGDMGLSPFTERTSLERDLSPEGAEEDLLGHVERDWSIAASSNRIDP